MGDADKLDVLYTYSVKYEPSDVAWASRWDVYLQMNNAEVCTYVYPPSNVHITGVHRSTGLPSSIRLSLCCCSPVRYCPFCSQITFHADIGAVAAILLRTLRRDIEAYNQDDEEACRFDFAVDPT